MPKGADEAAASNVVADPGVAARALNEAEGAWSGSMAMLKGATPLGTKATTVFVTVSMTLRVLSLRLDT